MTGEPLPLSRGTGHQILHAGRMVFGVAVGLVALGLVMVYSSTAAKQAGFNVDADIGKTIVDPSRNLVRQVRWVVLAAIVGWAVSCVPLSWLRRAAKPVLYGSIALLLLTLILGPLRNQSRRWLFVGPFSIQPSEFLKIGALLFLADQLSSRERANAFGTRTPLLAILAPVGVGAVLVLVAPDLGTSLFIVAEAVVLLGLAGVRPTRFVPFALMVTPLIVVYAYRRFGHVSKRIDAFAEGPKAGSQTGESLVAIGSGQWFGTGLGEGTQKLHYVAESQTDFIFAVIGEELGFLGCAGVVIAYMLLVWYGRRVAWHARSLNAHAFYLAAGATFIVTFQALVNIAVVTATVPTKGVSLPFISVGGSNLLMASVCVGLIVNVARKTAAATTTDPWE